MEMDQSEAVTHTFLVQHFQRLQEFCTGQSELRSIATALFPFSGATGSQFDADTDIRTDIHLLGFTGDDLQLVHLLHNDEDLLTHLLGQQGQFDITLILITVTDDNRVALTLHGDNGMQFGFRTSLQT